VFYGVFWLYVFCNVDQILDRQYQLFDNIIFVTYLIKKKMSLTRSLVCLRKEENEYL